MAKALDPGSEWDPSFTPSYTPKEMLELGVFEGKYINVIEGLPKSWYSLPKVQKEDEEPDISLNKFGVKSRQSLSHWKEKGWTTKDSPYGWFQWYCLYFLGRRLPEEDEWQIGRWRSFVARHQAQVSKNCKTKDNECRPVQRQGLLQWAWNSDTEFTEKQQEKNLKRLISDYNVKVIDSNEKFSRPASMVW